MGEGGGGAAPARTCAAPVARAPPLTPATAAPGARLIEPGFEPGLRFEFWPVRFAPSSRPGPTRFGARFAFQAGLVRDPVRVRASSRFAPRRVRAEFAPSALPGSEHGGDFQ